ncbi:CBS domain-containing protein [Streptomyces sp. ET3-23]|uniref:CBS domain-containing protein n=1 Tax=Streptomyces sp. ET3-23 TaxID=2885643 RepID=UPI001D1132D5|nr:CBS domain-containing protein [Streptomyces sp. ET3-23]MCC2274412.1 CBS domain-containing protein [Streptomyces sp. ET3-23]
MEIKYAMSSPPASVPPEATLEEAARRMADAKAGALPVVQDGRVIGVLTDRDLVVRAMAHGLSSRTRAEEVMSTDPVTVTADTPVTAALHAMRSINVRHLPVVDDGRLVGMVSFDDLFTYLSAQLGALADIVHAVRRAAGGSPRPHGDAPR